MRSVLKTMAVLLALTGAAAVPALAGGNGGCIDIELAVEPSTACPGDTVTVSTSVTNCGDRKDKVRFETVIEGPQGIGAHLLSVMKVPKQTEKSLSVPVELPPANIVPAPPGVPLGTFVVTVNATSKKGGSDSASATLDIVSCP